MATRLPLVQASGELQQLQLGDPLSPPSVSLLRVTDANYTMPGNTSLTSVDSFTLGSNTSLTIPSTSALLILGNATPRFITARVVNADFTTASVTAVNIPGIAITLAANKSYVIDAFIFGTTTSDGAGARFTISYSGTHGSNEKYAGWGNLGAAVSTVVGNVLGTGITTAFWTAGDLGTDHVSFQGAVMTTGTGSLTMQVSKATSGTVTIRQGSYMTATLVN